MTPKTTTVSIDGIEHGLPYKLDAGRARPHIDNEVRPYWQIEEYWVTLEGVPLWLDEIHIDHLTNILTLLRMNAARNRQKAAKAMGGKRGPRGWEDGDGMVLDRSWQESALDWIESTPLHRALMAELEKREAQLRHQQMKAQGMSLIPGAKLFPMQLELGL